MMSSKLKIAIAAGIGVAIVIIVVAVILARKKTPAPTNTPVNVELPPTYTVSVTQKDQSYHADIIVNKSTRTNVDQPELGRYVLVAFNGPIDIMWLSCPPDYNLQSPTSTTKSHILKDPEIGSGIELIKGQDNNLTVTCTKQ